MRQKHCDPAQGHLAIVKGPARGDREAQNSRNLSDLLTEVLLVTTLLANASQATRDDSLAGLGISPTRGL
jgi:hypothetical protein